MEDQYKQFDAYDEKRNAAYLAFNKEYEAENPQPERGRVDYSDLFIPIGLVIMVGASVYVSGSRTIEEFGGGSVGTAAFVMLEIAIVAFSFYITRMNVNIDRVQYTRNLGWVGVTLSFVCAVAANISDVLKKHGVYVSPEVATILNTLVAISAPTLAFISGHILAVEYLKFSQRGKELDRRLEEAKTVYKEAKHRAWQARKRQWGIKIQSEPVSVSHASLRRETRENLPSVAMQRAIDWLVANQGHLDTPSRQLEPIIGVSKATINRAQLFLKSDSGYTNGKAQ